MVTRLLSSRNDSINNFSETEIMINQATLCLALLNYAQPSISVPNVSPLVRPSITQSQGATILSHMPVPCL
jgi:hypothetical protein